MKPIVLCGDCASLLDGVVFEQQAVDLTFLDPPFNQDIRIQ